MIEKIPDYVIKIYNQFIDSGYEIYLVGGCVRDLMLSRETTDWDLTTNATPEQIQKMFSDSFYDNSFGTVGIPVEIDESTKSVLEVTTFRTEHGFNDRRHPESVEWGKSIKDDLSRRDFTVNAIGLKLISEREFEVVDPYGGQKDIESRVIKAVGNPELRFKEDALRLMRAIRLATQLDFSIDPQTMDEIINDSKLLSDISYERVRDELLKILASKKPYEGIMLLKDTHLLKYILPELLLGIGVSQERPGRHHKTDVFTHNVDSLKHCPSSDPIVRFAALIHDIGKPEVASKDIDGYVIFHNHEIVGARIASEICDRLRFSKKQKQKVVTLIRWHMFSVEEHTTDSAVRRFIRRVGVENIKDMIDLRIGDRLGSGSTAESWRLKLFRDRVETQLAPAPFSIRDLAVNGNDIMQELKMSPGPKVGKILEKLFEEVDENLDLNKKEFLIRRARELSNQ